MDAVEYRTHGSEANTLLDMSRCVFIKTCATTMSFAMMSYLLRHHTKEEIHRIFADLVDALEIVPVNTDAFKLKWNTARQKTLKTCSNTNVHWPQVVM
jgi:hypothetical protein